MQPFDLLLTTLMVAGWSKLRVTFGKIYLSLIEWVTNFGRLTALGIALAQARRSRAVRGVCVGPSALEFVPGATLGLRPRLVCVGSSALEFVPGTNLGLRPRLVCVGPSALKAEPRQFV